MKPMSTGKEQLKKGSWDHEEDQKLIAYIKSHGIKNWTLTPKAAGLSRSGKSCRLRWVNYLKPDLKRGRLTKEEIETIIKFHASLGNKWSEISKQLPGRTDNEIKNFWHTHMKKSRTGRGANTRKPAERTKREEKISVARPQFSISYAAEESNLGNCSTITESTDHEFPIAESYSPGEVSCAMDDDQINTITESYSSSDDMRNCSSSSQLHGEIHDDENFCVETFSMFDDLYLPEIDSTMVEEQGFAFQAQEYYNYQEHTAQILKNDDLASFWLNIFMEAKHL